MQDCQRLEGGTTEESAGTWGVEKGGTDMQRERQRIFFLINEKQEEMF